MVGSPLMAARVAGHRQRLLSWATEPRSASHEGAPPMTVVHRRPPMQQLVAALGPASCCGMEMMMIGRLGRLREAGRGIVASGGWLRGRA